jgi:aspartate racemase
MDRAIGVIGGVGPYAGIDLVKKVFDNSIAVADQEHLDLYMTSCPSLIPDRTEYLLHAGQNPAPGIIACFDKLARIGATVVVVPCNTAHAPKIYRQVEQWAQDNHPHVRFLNMIEETCRFLATLFPDGGTIGLMATLGTHGVGIYSDYLATYPHLRLLEPSAEGKKRVHSAIYDRTYGIKAVFPVSTRATEDLLSEARILIDQGAQVLILGCTELPLALKEGMLSCPLIDPTAILARAAIQVTAPEKLKNH